jgi:hypothetical protein
VSRNVTGALSGHAALEHIHTWKLFRFVAVLLVLSLRTGTNIVKVSVSYIDIVTTRFPWLLRTTVPDRIGAYTMPASPDYRAREGMIDADHA